MGEWVVSTTIVIPTEDLIDELPAGEQDEAAVASVGPLARLRSGWALSGHSIYQPAS